MAKTVYISMLEKDEAKGKNLFSTITRYGLAVKGHFWSDNMEKMEWAGPIPEMCAEDVGVWLIKGSLESYSSDKTLCGLSLLASVLFTRKGRNFPIILLCDDGVIDPLSLPTILQHAEYVEQEKLGAKLAAKANIPLKRDMEYRLDLHPLPGLGLWFEIGPSKGANWQGAMFGVSGDADIAAHGVGSAGQLPKSCVLNYPMQGIKLELNNELYLSWATKNLLSNGESYYVKVTGFPKSIVFGEYDESDSAELYSFKLY
ncbi:hypothetical protein [Celerinatantimonas sp. MCCC 1A17872]|uniref:hypothetical protein n=1 Tax=Celerinatantimonas sp. MCCC 1A17872 TaxID=3177514 RepID=UPI0038C87744